MTGMEHQHAFQLRELGLSTLNTLFNKVLGSIKMTEVLQQTK